jgi:SagB-type dehydrogenase family enzyme
MMEWTLSLAPSVVAVEAAPDEIVIRGTHHVVCVPHPDQGVRAVVRQLAESGADEASLRGIAVAHGGIDGLVRFEALLCELCVHQLLGYSVSVAGSPLLTALPLLRYRALDPEAAIPDQPLVLSRFAYLRRQNEHFVLDTPLSAARIVLVDPRALTILGALSMPKRLGNLGSVTDVPADVVLQAGRLLWASGMLTSVDDADVSAEDWDTTLRHWEFHDLLFHARSRAGRHAEPYGATYRFKGDLEPAPAVVPGQGSVEVDLFQPEIEKLDQSDPSFTRVLEARASRREFADQDPITTRELGEFLYRSARIRRTVHADGYEASNRVYPSGGAAYELEVYIAVARCAGLGPGLLHYRADRHQLARVAEDGPDVRALVAEAAAAARAENVQLLLILAARFRRLSWKYESIAYATALKNVGVLLQTFYLVATAMGLAGCAIGGGNADTFSRAAGTRYVEESSVGEFLLGRPRR